VVCRPSSSFVALNNHDSPQRSLLPSDNASRDDLLERIKANLRVPPKTST
jgi:GT2 family glycosyltransferase